MSNSDLREYARARRVPLWMVADELKISESTICRKLRHELSAEDDQDFRAAVDRIADGKVS